MDLIWPRVPKAPKKRRTPRLKTRRWIWKVRRQKRFTAAVKHWTKAKSRVEEKQSSEQGKGPLD
eukprot:6528060-Lingulodinium_polyedra.AAC.1